MKWKRLTAMAGALIAFGTASVNAQYFWLEDFDSYSTGSLVGQSAWEPWDNVPGPDGTVENSDFLTPPNGCFIGADDDVVHHFYDTPYGKDPTKGKWLFSAKTYMPSGSAKRGFLIMLNQYPNNKVWSVQIELDNSNQYVRDGINGGNTPPLIYDQWVPITVFIDLENDLVSQFYNGTALSLKKQWSRGGSTAISVVDLYGESGFSGFYYDDIKWEKAGAAPMIMTSSPNPVAVGQTHTLNVWGLGVQTGDLGFLYSWTVQRKFAMNRLMKFNFAAEGKWSFSYTVPAGIAGLELGMKAFGASSKTGNVSFSNEELVIYQ